MRRFSPIDRSRNFNKVFFFFIIPYVIFLLFTGGFPNVLSIIIIDFVIFLIIFIIFLFFYSQFIFPINKLSERWQAFNHTVLFLLHRHGPIVKIQGGEIKTNEENIKKNSPGCIWLDSASGAVLKKTTHFTRSIGPGITFSEKYEEIAETVDLRLQRQTVGPEANENPFFPKQKNEKEFAYLERINRGNQTRSLTQDGIEVIPSFSIIYKIDSKAGEGNSPFGYNPLAVQRAILGKIIRSNSVPEKFNNPASWSHLPGDLLIDVWRKLTPKFTFKEFISNSQNSTEIILNYMRACLTQCNVEEIQLNNEKARLVRESREFNILASRGIKVIEIHLQQIWYPPPIEAAIIDQWQKNHQVDSSVANQLTDEIRKKATEDGKKSAQDDLVHLICDSIEQIGPENEITLQILAHHLSSKSLSFIEKEKELSGKIPLPINQLIAIRDTSK